MEIILGIIVGILLIMCIVLFLLVRKEKNSNALLLQENSTLSTNISTHRDIQEAWQKEKNDLLLEKSTLSANVQLAEERLKNCQDTLRAVQEQAKQDEVNRKEQFQTELKLVEERMKSASETLLKQRSDELKATNNEQLGNIINPLQKELEQMRQLIHSSQEKGGERITTLDATIKAVMSQSQQLGKDTLVLAEALKNRGKVQGDWGEQILTNILEESGLRKGKEYDFQRNIKSEDGNDMRPDVIVYSADGSNIIIDSKVSLTAYTNYVGAENEAEREIAIKENYDSIWKHVMELYSKNYQKEVDHSIPLVLMFIPNEGSYILAMNKDPQLGQKAFKKGVLIINPTNLMLALQLILVTWQNTRQEENYTAIIKAAEGIYEKYVGFAENFAKVGERIENVKKAYDDAAGQLKDGKGNLSGRVQSLLKYGATSNKKIPDTLSSVMAIE